MKDNYLLQEQSHHSGLDPFICWYFDSGEQQHAPLASPSEFSHKQAGRLQLDWGNQPKGLQLIIWSDEPKEVCFFTQ